MDLARLVAGWSKDPSTKCGSVIVRSDKTVASVGFNGFPAGMPDDPAHYADREIKYSRVIHSEMNALLFLPESARHRNFTLYVWPMCPCGRCMAHIIQAGIRHVVCPTARIDRWGPEIDRALQMMHDAGGFIRYTDV